MEGRKIAGLVAVGLAVFIVSYVFLSQLLGGNEVLSRKQAIDVARGYFEEKFYEVENTELRSPTVHEVSSIQSFGQEPPDLVWVIEITLEPVGITYEELERASEASEEWGTKIYGATSSSSTSGSGHSGLLISKSLMIG
jgi:hypothetical protein